MPHRSPQKAALLQFGTLPGMTTNKAFDNLNRLTSIANVGVSSGNYLASSHSYTYNTANQRTGVQLKDGATWAYGYDALGQVISAKKKFSDGTFVPGEQFEYVEDDVGNRTSSKSGGDSTGASSALRSFSYTPNNLNQYTSRTVPNTVDVIGVANSSASVTVNSQAAYRKGEFYQKSITAANGGNQAVTVTATSGSSVTKTGNIFVPPASEAFTYDLDGNLTSDGRWNYVWDAENRLIRLTGKISGVQPTQVDYEYDWRGRRIKKVVTGTTTTTAKYLYDGWNLVAELDGSNALVRSYMWGLDLSGSAQGAGGVGGLLYTKLASGSAQFCAYDGNGNVMALVDGGNGGLTAEYEYGAFGETLRANGPSASLNPFRFSTKFTDDESDFVYYGYRYYNPGTGRWVSRDPRSERGGANLYAIVRNDLQNSVDYLGLTQVPLFDIWNLANKPAGAQSDCCGTFLILEMKGIDVPPIQQRDVPTPTLNGFKVVYLACPTCECPLNRIKLVQARSWIGFPGSVPPGFDAGGAKPVRGAYPEYPGYSDPNTGTPNFIDGPYNPIRPTATFNSEVCAVCNVNGMEKKLGCVTFSFDGGSRKLKVDGGDPIPSDDLSRLGGGGRSGGTVGSTGFSKGCSSPGSLWNGAEKDWNKRAQ